MRHELIILDGSASTEAFTPVVQLKRDPYTVVTSLFKNGKLYERGDTVMLDEKTAQRFIENGDVK